MAGKKTISTETPLQQREKVLAMLFGSGCRTEKELLSLALPEIVTIPGITVPDMVIILEIQKRVKAGKLYSWLAGESEEQNKTEMQQKERAGEKDD